MQTPWAKLSSRTDWTDCSREGERDPDVVALLTHAFQYLFLLYECCIWTVVGDTQIREPPLFFQIRLTSFQHSTLLYQLMRDIMRDATITNHLPFLLCMCEYSVFPLASAAWTGKYMNLCSAYSRAPRALCQPCQRTEFTSGKHRGYLSVKQNPGWSLRNSCCNRWLASITCMFCWHLFCVLSFLEILN